MSLANGVRLRRKYADATMIPRELYVDNLMVVEHTLSRPDLAGGAVVECGTWKGGMSAAMMEVGGTDRPYHFFDSFEGLPPAEAIDGAAAINWQSDTSSPQYYDNCSASLGEFNAVIRRAGKHTKVGSGSVKLTHHPKVSVYKGFFEDTFPGTDVRDIAVLRLDADWYSSTMACLEKFWDQVLPHGVVIIDDYGTWDGCTKAVHDFLSKRQRSEQIDKGPLGAVYYIEKRAEPAAS